MTTDYDEPASSVRTARTARPLALALTLTIGLTAPALATPSARLQATLTPEHPGQSTTIQFAAQITTPPGILPTPLTGLTLSYPAGIGIARSELGLETCTPTTLEVNGPEGCPADSRIGNGSATAEVQIGPNIETETANTSIFMAPIQNGDLAFLFYTNGQTPISAQVIFTGLLLPAPAPYGGNLAITTPLIPSWPLGPDIAVTSLRTTIDPRNLTYYEHTHGKTIHYHPKGIVLPPHCPHGGFPFAATFSFQDSSQTTARTTVPCLTRKRRHRTAHQAHSKTTASNHPRASRADVLSCPSQLTCAAARQATHRASRA